GTCRSEWFRIVPAASAAIAASGGTQPVRAPASTASTCCANTGIRTSCATRATSVAAGATTIEAPIRSATSAAIFARATAFGPIASGYALKFTTIAGVRTLSPDAEPVPPYKKAAELRGRRRRAGLVVLPPAAQPHHEEHQ